MIEKYIKEIQKMVPSAFQHKGDTLYLYGKLLKEDDYEPNPEILLPLVEAIKEGLLISVCFIDEKGLFNTLAECCTPNMLGFDITSDDELELEEFMKGQCGYAAVLSLSDGQEEDFIDMMFDEEASITLLGHITKGSFRVDDQEYGSVNDFIS